MSLERRQQQFEDWVADLFDVHFVPPPAARKNEELRMTMLKAIVNALVRRMPVAPYDETAALLSRVLERLIDTRKSSHWPVAADVVQALNAVQATGRASQNGSALEQSVQDALRFIKKYKRAPGELGRDEVIEAIVLGGHMTIEELRSKEYQIIGAREAEELAKMLMRAEA